jgi:hypothetical protein
MMIFYYHSLQNTEMVFYPFFFVVNLIGSYYYVKTTDVVKQQQEFMKFFSDCLNRKLTVLAQKVTATLEVFIYVRLIFFILVE